MKRVDLNLLYQNCCCYLPCQILLRLQSVPYLHLFLSAGHYYLFKLNNKEYKKYSAKEIIQLINGINDFLRINNDINKQLFFLNNINKIDVNYYFYIKNSSFYMNLFNAIEQSKKLYFQSRDFTYNLNPPLDFYGKNYKKGNIYTSLEIMEIYAYTYYLIQNKIIKELPEPIFISN